MLFQVYNARLDSTKGWYVFNEESFSSAFRKYKENAFFRLFPNEIHRIPVCELRDNNGNAVDPDLIGVKYRKCNILVVSTLGLCGGLLRQHELNDESYLTSNSFQRIAKAINSHCAITGLPRNGAISSLSKELNEAKAKIMELQNLAGIQVHADDKSAKSNRLTKKSAGEILCTLEDVCDRHKTSVASVLGHLCTHDPVKQPSEARNIISEIVSSVTEKKGVKRGLEDLVPDVLQEYLHQFRVPDWVLLYFKLEAKIPDEGWQMMINLTKLGRTRVSYIKLLLSLWKFVLIFCIPRGGGGGGGEEVDWAKDGHNEYHVVPPESYMYI